jgi:hypothetical protein
MRKLTTKTDGVSSLPADQFNANHLNELQNVVESVGISLDPEGGGDTDLFMLTKTLATYGSDGGFYQDSGTADAYALTRIIGTFKSPKAYFDGMSVSFVVGNSNTGASTINVVSLGSKAITDDFGNALTGGELVAGKYVTLRYDAGADEFRIVRTQLITVSKFASSGTWTKPDGLMFALVLVIGAGGGGGGADGQGSGFAVCASGGCGGGWALDLILAKDLGATETVTVGAGGTGGTGAGGGDGTDGGTSSFGSHCQATGGDKGIGAVATSGNLVRIAGDGGQGSGASIVNAKGGSGGEGVVIGGETASLGYGGETWAVGGVRGKSNGQGDNGENRGTGGGGAGVINTTSDFNGGNGADGQVIVYEFY